MTKVDLTKYSRRDDRPEGYHHGRSFLVRMIWHYISAIVFQSQMFPFYGMKVALLRAFGAKVGEDVLIKPSVNIKYPWFLEIGDHVWIGEDVWLDCTKPIRIGNHVVISQGAYLCPAAHDWSDPGMGSFGYPIVVEDGAWISAFARIALGVTIGEEAVVLLGAVVMGDCEARAIYRGNPAVKIADRKIRDYVGPKRDDSRPDASAAPQPTAAGGAVT